MAIVGGDRKHSVLSILFSPSNEGSALMAKGHPSPCPLHLHNCADSQLVLITSSLSSGRRGIYTALLLPPCSLLRIEQDRTAYGYPSLTTPISPPRRTRKINLTWQGENARSGLQLVFLVQTKPTFFDLWSAPPNPRTESESFPHSGNDRLIPREVRTSQPH
eukprot:388815-Rhodomonas_salina.1